MTKPLKFVLGMFLMAIVLLVINLREVEGVPAPRTDPGPSLWFVFDLIFDSEKEWSRR